MAPDDTTDSGDEQESWLQWPDDTGGDDNDEPGEPDMSDEPIPTEPIAPEPDDGAALIVDADQPSSLPAVIPAVAGRIDNVASAIGALSMRLDSLIATTTTYRSVMSDRLTEYNEIVSKLNRGQAADLDEFRTANERTVGELRRSLTSAEETLRDVVGTTERIAADVAALTDRTRAGQAETREVIDATDKLGRFVTEALDQFAERVLNELKGFSETLTPEVSSVRADLALTRESLDDLNERASNRPVREAIDELRSDMSGLRRAVLEWPDLELVRDEVVALRADLTNLLARPDDESDAAATLDPAVVFAPIVDRIAALEASVSSINEPLIGRIGELEASVASVHEAVGNVHDVVGTVHEAVAAVGAPSVDEILAPLLDRMGAIEAAITEVPAAELDPAVLEEIQSELAQVRTAVGRGTDMSGLVDELANLQSRVAQIPSLDTLRSELEGSASVGASATLSADLAEVRADLSGIRNAIDELIDAGGGDEPAALADIRQAIDDLQSRPAPGDAGLLEAVRSDIAGLRAEVEEQATRVAEPPAPSTDPALAAAISADLDGLRSELAELRATVTNQTFEIVDAGGGGADDGRMAEEIAALRSEIADLREQVSKPLSSDPLLESLRDEIVALRRRMKVRPNPSAE